MHKQIGIRGRHSSLLVLFIGSPLGVSFSFLILIVLLLSFPGRWSGGFSILPNACPLLVMIFVCLAFVLLPVSLCSICFLTFFLAISVLSWFQSLLFCASPMSPSILVRHVVFGFSGDKLFVIPRVFVNLLNVC